MDLALSSFEYLVKIVWIDFTSVKIEYSYLVGCSQTLGVIGYLNLQFFLSGLPLWNTISVLNLSAISGYSFVYSSPWSILIFLYAKPTSLSFNRASNFSNSFKMSNLSGGLLISIICLNYFKDNSDLTTLNASCFSNDSIIGLPHSGLWSKQTKIKI